MLYNKINGNLSNMIFLSRIRELMIFFFLLCSFDAIPQVGVPAEPTALDHIDLIDLMEKVNTNWVLDDRNEAINGSPYLSEEFIKGEIVLIDNSVLSDVLLRYNIYNDELEFQDKGINYFIGTKHLLKKVKLGDNTFVVDIYDSSIGEKQGFFTLLADGEVKLLCKYEMELTDRIPAKPMRDPEPRKFVRQKDLYFVKVGLQRIHEFSSVKKLIGYFGDHQDELRSFTKKEKISPNNPDELADLINYYNSL
ncbi:hypothetical protein ACFLU5_11290 [Bacteroidota bacterium]